jgi:hypothetical protein
MSTITLELLEIQIHFNLAAYSPAFARTAPIVSVQDIPCIQNMTTAAQG